MLSSLKALPSEKPNSIWSLPRVKGKYLFDYSLSKITWFKVGGMAQILYKPDSIEDLCLFFKEKDPSMPVYVLGAASNVLIRDGGLKGCVIKLGKEFSKIYFSQKDVIVGAGCLDRTLVLECANMGLSGLEFLVGIPGTIGGAIAMNAGAYGFEIKEFIKWVEIIKQDGSVACLDKKDLNMSYRHGNLPHGSIVVRVCFSLNKENHDVIQNRIVSNLQNREATQPVQGRTGGSTFKNPAQNSLKAWEYIDEAGCRGLRLHDAQISEKHCNFMLNTNEASAKDLEDLGEEVRRRVFEQFGVDLEWEIIRLGES